MTVPQSPMQAPSLLSCLNPTGILSECVDLLERLYDELGTPGHFHRGSFETDLSSMRALIAHYRSGGRNKTPLDHRRNVYKILQAHETLFGQKILLPSAQSLFDLAKKVLQFAETAPQNTWHDRLMLAVFVLGSRAVKSEGARSVALREIKAIKREVAKRIKEEERKSIKVALRENLDGANMLLQLLEQTFIGPFLEGCKTLTDIAACALENYPSALEQVERLSIDEIFPQGTRAAHVYWQPHLSHPPQGSLLPEFLAAARGSFLVTVLPSGGENQGVIGESSPGASWCVPVDDLAAALKKLRGKHTTGESGRATVRYERKSVLLIVPQDALSERYLLEAARLALSIRSQREASPHGPGAKFDITLPGAHRLSVEGVFLLSEFGPVDCYLNLAIFDRNDNEIAGLHDILFRHNDTPEGIQTVAAAIAARLHSQHEHCCGLDIPEPFLENGNTASRVVFEKLMLEYLHAIVTPKNDDPAFLPRNLKRRPAIV